MSDKVTYTNNAQQRIIHLIEKLAGNEMEGLPLKSLSKDMSNSIPAIYRDLKNLEEVGWAEQKENSSWVLTPRAAEPLKKISDNLRTILGQVNKINKDYIQGEA